MNVGAGGANEGLAEIELHRKHYKESLALLDQAERQMSDNAKIAYWRFYALLGDGQYAAAEVAREQFLKTDPAQAVADEIRAVVIPDGRPATEPAERSGMAKSPAGAKP